jgi:hypothetical protein
MEILEYGEWVDMTIPELLAEFKELLPGEESLPNGVNFTPVLQSPHDAQCETLVFQPLEGRVETTSQILPSESSQSTETSLVCSTLVHQADKSE